MKKLFIIALLAVGLIAASNPPLPGPNNGQVTVQNSSTSITPVVFPGRFSITFLNPSTTITIYVCQATQKDASTGYISATLKTCSSSVADIILAPGVSYNTPPNSYTGQYTAITSTSTQTLVISEN
jgi:hypothetical protein